jgi:hypothetical protein
MVLHGVGDRLVPDGPLKAMIEVLPPRADSKLAFYKNGYHLLMRDKDGAKVSTDIEVWISDHEAKLPSGADAPGIQPKLATAWGTKREREAVSRSE